MWPKDAQFNSEDTDTSCGPLLRAQGTATSSWGLPSSQCPVHHSPALLLGALSPGLSHLGTGTQQLANTYCNKSSSHFTARTVYKALWPPHFREEETKAEEMNWWAEMTLLHIGTVPSPGHVVLDDWGSIRLGLVYWPVNTSCFFPHRSCVLLGYVLKKHFLHWCFQNY